MTALPLGTIDIRGYVPEDVELDWSVALGTKNGQQTLSEQYFHPETPNDLEETQINDGYLDGEYSDGETILTHSTYIHSTVDSTSTWGPDNQTDDSSEDEDEDEPIQDPVVIDLTTPPHQPIFIDLISVTTAPTKRKRGFDEDTVQLKKRLMEEQYGAETEVETLVDEESEIEIFGWIESKSSD